MGHELCLSVPGVHHRLQLLAGRAGLLHRTGQDGLGALAELRHHVTRGHLLALFLKFIYLYFFISYSFYILFFILSFSSLLSILLSSRSGCSDASTLPSSWSSALVACAGQAFTAAH